MTADWPDPVIPTLSTSCCRMGGCPPLLPLLSPELHSQHWTLTPPRPRIPPKSNITIFYSPEHHQHFPPFCAAFPSHLIINITGQNKPDTAYHSGLVISACQLLFRSCQHLALLEIKNSISARVKLRSFLLFVRWELYAHDVCYVLSLSLNDWRWAVSRDDRGG